jgi:hypothetical protein
MQDNKVANKTILSIFISKRENLRKETKGKWKFFEAPCKYKKHRNDSQRKKAGRSVQYRF